jgi:hypothetical protein
MNTEIVAGEEVKVKRKRGDVREDGKVFWQLDKYKKEIWYSPEVYAEKAAAMKAYAAEYQAKNREKLKAYLASYFQENKEKLNAANRTWAKENKNARSAHQRKWLENNRESRNVWRAKRAVERRKTDPIHAMREVARTRIRHALNNKGFKRQAKTAIMVGCSWAKLKLHIESQFVDGMSWENRHLWEVDHIIPLSSANTQEDIIKLSHFSNLQPLWKEDNRSKSDKMPDNP